MLLRIDVLKYARHNLPNDIEPGFTVKGKWLLHSTRGNSTGRRCSLVTTNIIAAMRPRVWYDTASIE